MVYLFNIILNIDDRIVHSSVLNNALIVSITGAETSTVESVVELDNVKYILFTSS